MRIFAVITLIGMTLSLPVEGLCADERPDDALQADPLAPTRGRLMDRAFVVETTEDDVDESLNRISGDIDLGFAAPQYTYDSSSHGLAGALQRSQQNDSQNSY